MYYTFIDSPLGKLTLISDGLDLTGLYMERELDQASGSQSALSMPRSMGSAEPLERHDAEPFQQTIEQLREFFDKKRTSFDIPIKLQGTDFQMRVWSELLKIPYGTTISYGELAKRVGSANASRAVGLANGSNRISIIVPCHRVIGANGTLTGYGGGLPNKKLLLELEGSAVKQLVLMC